MIAVARPPLTPDWSIERPTTPGRPHSWLRAAALTAVVLGGGCDHDTEGSVSPDGSGPTVCDARLEARDVLPSNAMIVARYDMKRERQHAPRAKSGQTAGPRALMPVELDVFRAGWISIAAACELPDDFLSDGWLAVDREFDVTLAIEGKGVGKEEHLRCIRDRLAMFGDDFIEDTKIKPLGCGTKVRFDYMHGFAPHDDLIVFGTRKAIKRTRGTTRANANPPLQLMPGKTARSWVWGAADLPALLDPEALDPDVAEELAVFGNIRKAHLDVKLGLKFSFTLGGTFATEADARAAEAVVQAFVDTPPPALGPELIKAVKQLKVVRKGTAVTAELPLPKKRAHELGLVPTKDEAKQMPIFAIFLGIAAVL